MAVTLDNRLGYYQKGNGLIVVKDLDVNRRLVPQHFINTIHIAMFVWSRRGAYIHSVEWLLVVVNILMILSISVMLQLVCYCSLQ